ncbi:rod-binding protein [Hoeflea sp. TYP-13]|uniref:rod-binding protein n=1 Tax=Hoeflea sp. TYP-13 TaxID=3230023 RepID=UPI0034C5C265
MSISPPSDLVLDVVRAADPESVREAHRKLLDRASAASQTAFEAVANRPVGAEVKVQDGDIPQTYRDFEAMVLQSFVKHMLPTDAENVFGEGTAGDVWKGMMAEQLGNALAKGGGIGIAQQLAAQRAIAESNEERAAAAGNNLNYANGLVQQIQLDMLRAAEEFSGLFDEQT